MSKVDELMKKMDYKIVGSESDKEVLRNFLESYFADKLILDRKEVETLIKSAIWTDNEKCESEEFVRLSDVKKLLGEGR